MLIYILIVCTYILIYILIFISTVFKCLWKWEENLTSLMPSQSARSLALASAVDKPTTLTLCPVVADMKLVLETTTSNTGPLSAPAYIKNINS